MMQLVIIRQESSGNEFRIKSLTDELNAMRAALIDREATLSKLRIEMRESAERLSKATSLVQMLQL